MIILRPEKFGGIAFNTKNASELWLQEWLPNKDREKFLSSLKGELDAPSKDEYRILPSLPNIGDHDFPVLNSPTLADINITYQCNLNCPHCYMESKAEVQRMSWEEFYKTVEEVKKSNVLQVALGGGEPTTHPQFRQMLQTLYKNNIVVNVSTNGYNLKWRTVYAMAKYTGAVALSVEEVGDRFEKMRNFPFRELEKSITKLRSAGINLVFHVVVGSFNIERLENIVTQLLRYDPYGILFLAYKPAGRGKEQEYALSSVPFEDSCRIFSNVVRSANKYTKIGVDCCLAPLISEISSKKQCWGCSAARTSVAIMPDLRVRPCSFPENMFEQEENLTKKSLLDIWQGSSFNRFRENLASGLQNDICGSCELRYQCLGGCPEFSLCQCRYSS